MEDDEDAFLYGDDDQQPIQQVTLEEDKAETVNQDEQEEEDGEEEEDSDSDLEIVLDNTAATAQRITATPYVRPQGPPAPTTTEYNPLARGSIPLQPGAQAPVSILTTPRHALPQPQAATTTTTTVPPARPVTVAARPALGQLVSSTSVVPAAGVAVPSELPAEVQPVKAPSTAPTLSLEPNEASLVLPGLGPEGAPGSIYDVDPTTMPDKPWRRPGAELSDYFNYGFDEESWKEYGDMKRGRAREREDLMSQKQKALHEADGTAGGGAAGQGELMAPPNPYLASLQPAQIQLLQAMQGMMPGMTLEQRAVFMGFIPPPQMQMQLSPALQQQQQQQGFDMATAQNMLAAAQAQGASPHQIQQMQMQIHMQMQQAAAQQAQQQQAAYAGVPSGPAQRPPPNAPSGPAAARIAPPNRPSPAPEAGTAAAAAATSVGEPEAAGWGAEAQQGSETAARTNGTTTSAAAVAVKREESVETHNGNGDDSSRPTGPTRGWGPNRRGGGAASNAPTGPRLSNASGTASNASGSAEATSSVKGLKNVPTGPRNPAKRYTDRDTVPTAADSLDYGANSTATVVGTATDSPRRAEEVLTLPTGPRGRETRRTPPLQRTARSHAHASREDSQSRSRSPVQHTSALGQARGAHSGGAGGRVRETSRSERERERDREYQSDSRESSARPSARRSTRQEDEETLRSAPSSRRGGVAAATASSSVARRGKNVNRTEEEESASRRGRDASPRDRERDSSGRERERNLTSRLSASGVEATLEKEPKPDRSEARAARRAGRSGLAEPPSTASTPSSATSGARKRSAPDPDAAAESSARKRR